MGERMQTWLIKDPENVSTEGSGRKETRRPNLDVKGLRVQKGETQMKE